MKEKRKSKQMLEQHHRFKRQNILHHEECTMTNNKDLDQEDGNNDIVEYHVRRSRLDTMLDLLGSENQMFDIAESSTSTDFNEKSIVNNYLDLGDCCYNCSHCGALFWFNERLKNSNIPKFNLCCKDGKIVLPLMKQTPPILDNLLSYYTGTLSSHFRKNIRIYNAMFAFTSFGSNIESDIKNSNGPYIFKICGQIHHLMGSLLPDNNNQPKFAQLYIYDTENEVQNRMAIFSFNDDSKNIAKKVIKN